MTHKPTPARVTGHEGKTRAAVLAPEVARLHAAGLSRNRIAGELGCSAGTVTNAARIAGVVFDRSATRAATEAAVSDARSDRVALECKLRGRVHEALDALDMGVPRDARDLAMVAGILLDKSLRIIEFDRVESMDVSDAMAYLAAMRGH